MKGRRLIITYNESLKANIKDGFKESYRCNSVERAKEILASRAPGLVKQAQYRGGKEDTIIDLV